MKNKVLLLLASISLIAASESIQINGKVQYEGKAPKPKKLNMAADPICGKSHTGPVFNESFLINKEKYIQNVVVWINNPKHSAKIPETAVVLDQIGCQYIPHVTGIMKGQDLMIKNSDKTLHNIHSMSEVNSNFNFAMPAKSDPSTKNFNKTEDPFYIKCDVHPWMKSWIVVLEHPYWAVTDGDGNYSMALDSLEPGTYDLCFWHEKWDKSMKGTGYCADEYKTTVTITDQSVDVGTQTFKRPTKKK
tara:strand:+ start:74 stop:814 length:741 start_codon:yes stop_codon:yes gene_type:complete